MTDTYVPTPKRRSVSMPFDKPDEGWTRRHGLATGDVPFDDSVDPA